MEDNKIFIVETTNKGEWETNHGYHLVKSSDIGEARSIAKDKDNSNSWDKRVPE